MRLISELNFSAQLEAIRWGETGKSKWARQGESRWFRSGSPYCRSPQTPANWPSRCCACNSLHHKSNRRIPDSADSHCAATLPAAGSIPAALSRPGVLHRWLLAVPLATASMHLAPLFFLKEKEKYEINGILLQVDNSLCNMSDIIALLSWGNMHLFRSPLHSPHSPLINVLTLKYYQLLVADKYHTYAMVSLDQPDRIGGMHDTMLDVIEIAVLYQRNNCFYEII